MKRKTTKSPESRRRQFSARRLNEPLAESFSEVVSVEVFIEKKVCHMTRKQVSGGRFAGKVMKVMKSNNQKAWKSHEPAWKHWGDLEPTWPLSTRSRLDWCCETRKTLPRKSKEKKCLTGHKMFCFVFQDQRSFGRAAVFNVEKGARTRAIRFEELQRFCCVEVSENRLLTD